MNRLVVIMWGHQYLILLPILACLVNSSLAIGTLVETDAGMIQGIRDNNDSYSMFMGIPYATVNASNAFGAAIPHPKFEGVFQADDDSAICPQVEEFNNTITGSLDCLHINIYVPDSATPTNKLPVLVWIYGGGFSIGFSGRYLYGPKYLIRHDIILVTFNYRIGPYGFMCLNIPEVPGNIGLKDQILALEWIQANIEYFAGDASKVTIYGMSAGGVAVDAHYMFGDHSLFDKLILHSGTAMTPNTIRTPDTTAALKLAQDLGFVTNDNMEALKFLSTVHPHEIIASHQALGIRLGLCVEEEFDGVERLIHTNPLNLKGPDASEKAVLLAYNRDELHMSFMTAAPESFPGFSSRFMNDLQSYFRMDSATFEKNEAIIRQFYMGDEGFTQSIRLNLARYASDFQYIHPTFKSVKRFVDNGCQKVYHFVYSISGERSFVLQRNNLTQSGLAVHADEVGYLFDVSYMGTPSAVDQLAIDRITTLWANFVKYGNPTPQLTELLPVTWEPATVETIPYLELDSEVRVGKRHNHAAIAFWDLFYELNRDAQIGYEVTSSSGIWQRASLLMVALIAISMLI